MAFERGLVLSVSKLDSIHCRKPPSVPELGLFVLAIGTQERAAERAHVLLEGGAGEALVADHDLAGFEDTLERLGGDEPFGRVRGGELEADREPVRGAEQVDEAVAAAALLEAVGLEVGWGLR